MTYELHHLKILIVEDNQPMLNLTRSILQTFGVGTVSTATNGLEGFESFCSLNHDIIIADWMMRPTDGIALTKMVRNDQRSPNQYVPIILMTGFGDKDRVIAARDSGVTEFLVKPFNTRDLYTRLVQVIEKPRQFIRSEEFFGPDRRRKPNSDFDGDLKRQTDTASDKYTNLEYFDTVK